jgi:hypothetical protein
MAILSDYTAGTVSVAAGGTAVTGVGTAWSTAGFQEGDEFFAAGWHGIIQSVTSNTALTLYPTGIRGAALSNAAYRLRYQGDGSRLTAQARQLIELLGSGGNIEALSGLVGAANKLPFFTGAGTMSLANLTAFARSILDDADGAAAYGTLGEIPNAQLPNRLRSAGEFPEDFNTVTETGFYVGSTVVLNAPSTGPRWFMIHQTYNTNFMAQICIQWASIPRLYYRFYSTGIWGGWQLFGINILGAVSQSAGVPSGAIIERGSNANGEYVRFADGTQICTGALDSGDVSQTSGSLFVNNGGVIPWTYPVAFSTPPTILGAQSGSSTRWISGVSRNSTSGNFRVVATGTAGTIGFGVMATGRWF